MPRNAKIEVYPIILKSQIIAIAELGPERAPFLWLLEAIKNILKRCLPALRVLPA